ncbi:MAG: peptidase [Rhodobacteraceae bacterium]|nr:peptidase [Paracoccaceae bacterium]
MKDGTKEEYELLHELEKPYLAMTADRVMDELRRHGETTLEGYKITRLQHGLQSATRAEEDGVVRWEVSWVIEHHGIFQMLYYAHHYGWDKDARDRYRDHPCFDTCAKFCERWDQSSFDPDYPTKPLEYFEPMVREVFSRKAYDPAVIQDGVSIGL